MKVPKEDMQSMVPCGNSEAQVRYTASNYTNGERVLGGGEEDTEEIVCRCNGTAQELMSCLLATKQYQPMVDGIENAPGHSIDEPRRLVAELCKAKICCAEDALCRKAELGITNVPYDPDPIGKPIKDPVAFFRALAEQETSGSKRSGGGGGTH